MKKFFKHTILLFTVLLTIYGCKSDGSNNLPTNPIDGSLPANPIPEDGAINQDNLISLSWQFEGADSFTVYLDTTNPPGKIVKRNLTEKNATIFAAGASTKYFWQVEAIKADLTRLKSPVWSFTTKAQSITPPGFVMVKHSLTTAPPHSVRLLFQVLNLDSKGVPGLSISDFELYENSQRISHLESNLRITKKDDNIYKIKTVLMLDNSTSLTDGGSNDLEQIKDAAKNFVNNMLDEQLISIFKFSGTVEKIIDFTSKANKFQLIDAINTISRGAMSTNLYGAVIEGSKELKEHYGADSIIQSTMILFTDGDDTQGSRTLDDALNSIAGKKVFTVGLGVDINPNVLQLIGTSGFYLINESSQLNQIFVSIGSELADLSNSFYWMEYESPKRGNFQHLLKLFIISNAINSFIEGTFSSAGFFDAQPGIYFNSSFGNPLGDSDIPLISGGDAAEIYVNTFGGAAKPFYSWSDEPLLNINYLDQIRSSVAVGALPGIVNDTTVTITVTDIYNGFSKTLNFAIFKP